MLNLLNFAERSNINNISLRINNSLKLLFRATIHIQIYIIVLYLMWAVQTSFNFANILLNFGFAQCHSENEDK
jgi:hypothetical protein